MNGRTVRPDHIGKELEESIVECAKRDLLAQAKKRARGIRDPNAGTLPRLRVKGNRLDRSSVEVRVTLGPRSVGES